MTLSRTTAGLLAVGGAAALWAGAAAVASHLFNRGVVPLELVQARAVIAALGLGLLMLVGRRSQRRRRGDARPREELSAFAGVITLGLALALVNLAYYLAIDRLAVAVAVVLQYSAPALVVSWAAVVSGRKPTRPVLASLVAALTGVILVSELLAGELGRLDFFGIAMGLASAALFATYTLLSEKAEAHYGPVGAMARAFGTASIFWILVQLPSGWPSALFEPAHLVPVLFVGVAGTLVPFLLYVWGVARIRSERASIAATLEPVLAAVFAWIWLDQSLSPTQLAGGTLVLVAVGSLHAARVDSAHA
ncbi:MAG: EamA family transporter [Actinomycetota bacterium]|nr:EamA family transporter [Actinomycetota bacterium]